MKRNLFLLILSIILLIVGVFFGSSILTWNELWESPIAELRFIRMLGAFFIGGSLALSGLIFQAILKNVLAEPFTLGISGGASIGTAIAFIWGLHSITIYAVPFSALLGSLIVLAIVLAISFRSNYSSENLLLSGIIVGTLAGSLLMYLISISDAQDLASITYFMLGDLQAVNPQLLLFLGIYASFAVLFFQYFASEINAISLGDESAFYQGVNTRKMSILFTVAAAFLSASTVALAGIIGFCGLIIPHIVRRLWGCDHRKIMVSTFGAGGIFLMLCDIGSRVIFTEREIPIGILSAFIGGPLFLFILRRQRSFK